MAFARLATYELRPGTLDRTIDKAKRELYPEFDALEGVLSYEIVRGEGEVLVSFATCRDRRVADEMARLAGDWVKKNLRDDIVRSSFHLGEVAVSRGTPEQV